MNTHFLFSVLVSSLLAGFGARAQSPAPAAGLAAPESVAADAAGTRFYVSNIGAKLDPAARDGDGYVSELDARGRVRTARLLPAPGEAPLNAPKGLAVVGHTLYVADIDRIVGFDLTIRQQTAVVSFADTKAAFLNDVLALGDTALLVSASDQGRAYALTLRTGRIRPLRGRAPGANGLAYDAGRGLLYVVTLGPGFNGQGQLLCRPLAEAGEFAALPVAPGFFDGVAVQPDGQVLYSDWVSLAANPPAQGAVWRYNPATRQATAVPLPAGTPSPADFCYDARRNQLLVPSTLSSRVVVVPVPAGKSPASHPAK
ncbi:SMP-30/gluconolactonase/LRE family protein [Hymenobacter terrenus]|uniref:SMP-30/gluconolactonase/LRE family protein n=1 Tax=Hymenobacter terrenus TaxID=1629124 RepID=UPI00069867B4|nr:hypothetical protein [Hymenobacter terrenus]